MEGLLLKSIHILARVHLSPRTRSLLLIGRFQKSGKLYTPGPVTLPLLISPPTHHVESPTLTHKTTMSSIELFDDQSDDSLSIGE